MSDIAFAVNCIVIGGILGFMLGWERRESRYIHDHLDRIREREEHDDCEEPPC